MTTTAPATQEFLLTVDDYYKMAEVGIIPHNARVELINGKVRYMSPINSPHASMVNRLTRILNKLLEGRATISPQNPIDLGAKYSEPEPDIAVAKYRTDDYEEFHPRVEDIFLLIEVADSSLMYDRTEKLAMYADKKIEEYWIVNLGRKKVEIYRQPKGKRYEFKQVIERNGILTCESIDFQLDVKEVLG